MEVMRREIFGPILPIRLYDRGGGRRRVNAGDRPLAIYPFTNDHADARFLYFARHVGRRFGQRRDVHVAQHDLPFGGVGASGMGHYHGREGFETFSKLRPVFQQGRMSSGR